MALIWWLAATGRIVAPVEPRASGAEVRRAFVRAIPALLAPVILVAGLLSGAATPTELGAITVLYALIVGFAQRELTVRRVWRCLVEIGVTVGVLVFIIAAAVPFGWVISVHNLPAQLAATILSFTDNTFVVLAIINVILLLAGLVLETTAILLIAVPALLPIALALDIDLVHFGVMIVFNLLVGAATPPFGVLLFIVMDIARVGFSQILRAMLPFYVPRFTALLLITY